MNKYANLEILKGKNSVCLISHISPDADALSSMIVLKEFLISHFNILNVDIFAEQTDNLETYRDIIQPHIINSTIKEYDTAIMLDSPNCERLGIYKRLFTSAKQKIVIDHHATNDYSGDLNIVEMCSSTCEIIYSIIKSFNYEISRQNKGKLYTGIITDTNNFSVGNYNSRTFKIVSEIIDEINNAEIYNQFLSNNSLEQMNLLSKAIRNIKSYSDGKIIISHIDKKDLSECHATQNDCSGIINKLSTISNSKLVCFIYPTVTEYYVSMRAKNGYDVSSIAKSHNGGGHTGAAAYLSLKNVDDIKIEILDEFTKQLNSTQETNQNLF